MCFIISNDLYTAHHYWLGICHQLKICHLYEAFDFSTRCICMGTGSLFVHGFCGKARPLRMKTGFAVASIWENWLTHLAQLLWGVNPDSGLLMNRLCVLLMPKIGKIYIQETWILNSSFKLATKFLYFLQWYFQKLCIALRMKQHLPCGSTIANLKK